MELPYTDEGVSALVNEKLIEFPGGSRSEVGLLATNRMEYPSPDPPPMEVPIQFAGAVTERGFVAR